MPRPSRPLFTAPLLGLGVLAMAGILACGGSSATGSAPKSAAATVATRLTYAAPTGTGYRLVANGASTATHLVLDLVGPSGATAQGVIFEASCDGRKAVWSAPDTTSGLVKPGGALALGAGLPLLNSRANGQEMSAALFQKAGTPAATLGGTAIFSLALDLKPGTKTGEVALVMRPGTKVIDATGTASAIDVAVGTVVAN